MGTSRLNARQLQEPQTLGVLRAAGWQLPPDRPDTELLRVYDTRLEATWLRGVLAEMELGLDKIVRVGGDFLTAPHLEEQMALHPGRLQRWGPPGAGPYHLVVPPRPHVESWMRRVRQQLPLEASGTWVSIGVVVPRDRCPQLWDAAALRRAVPSAGILLEDPTLEIRLVAIGERAAVVRVPADQLVLPPPRWEHGLLPRDRVLLFLNVRLQQGDRMALQCRWLRDPPPPIEGDDLELLRLEYILPPATKAVAGERALRGVLRKVTSILGQATPSGIQLRQVQVAHGAVFALLGVPRAVAVHWLRGSGCEGLFIRPFWNPSTGPALDRSNFSLLWLQGSLDKGPQLWQALREVPGFFGLVGDGRDLGVRVSVEADRRLVQSQVEFVLGSGSQLRSPVPGLRWWRLGPLTEAEAWHVKDLIAQTGLELARVDVRLARMGPFRLAAFFAATGTPVKTSFDDGSWTSSAAKLSPAEPPPRRKPAGPALTSQSMWAGPRSAASPSAAPVSFPPPAQPSTPTVWPSASMPPPPPVSTAAPSAPQPSASGPPTAGGRGGRGGRARGRGGRAAGSLLGDTAGGGPPTSGLEAQVASLVAQLGVLTQEIRELRHENAELRRQLDLARGVHQHQPYSLAPLPPPSFSPVTPIPGSRTRTAGEVSPGGIGVEVGTVADVVMPSPPMIRRPSGCGAP